MDKDLLKDSRVTWISHRGNAHSFPENTAAAFDCAVADGFPVLETDLRPTSDGHIVLSHDRSLLRVAGVDRPVDLLTRAELEKIGLGEGHRLLFLDQFIDRYREKRWIFDLKAENAHVTIRNMKSLFQDEAIASLVLERTTVLCWTSGHQRMMRDELGFQSFYARKWQCFRAAMSVLLKVPFLGGIEARKAYGILPEFAGVSLFTPSFIDRYHGRGAKVIAFLPDPEQARQAIEAGVDLVLLDYRE